MIRIRSLEPIAHATVIVHMRAAVVILDIKLGMGSRSVTNKGQLPEYRHTAEESIRLCGFSGVGCGILVLDSGLRRMYLLAVRCSVNQRPLVFLVPQSLGS